MSTLADWVGAAAAALMPLVEVIRAHVSGRVCVDRQQKNAIREARALGLITMEERRRRGQPSLTNIVRIISSEWLAWLRIGPKAPGVKKLTSTVSKSSEEERQRGSAKDCIRAAGLTDDPEDRELRISGGRSRALCCARSQNHDLRWRQRRCR